MQLLDIGFPKCARGSQLLSFYATKLLRINSPNEQETTGAPEHTLWAIVCVRIAEGLWPLLLIVLEGSRSVADNFEVRAYFSMELLEELAEVHSGPLQSSGPDSQLTNVQVLWGNPGLAPDDASNPVQPGSRFWWTLD